MGRCKATNLCDYCARLAAVENAEVLAQDALSNSAPALWTVLTTRSTVGQMSAYKVARMAVRRAVRREWDHAEAAVMVEFTTGMGTRSEGRRRPHWNDVWKGVPAADVDDLQSVVAAAWCARVDALPEGQYAGAINETGGLMRYLALHFQKESQQPPKGWRGQRFGVTRGYLAESMEFARIRARQALRYRRELWRAQQALGESATAEQLHDVALAALIESLEMPWSLVRLVQLPTGFTAEGDPSGWVEVPLAVR
jgi:hypothetical protein